MPDLTELQRLAEGATPGPWYVDEDPRPGMEWNRHITSGATALTVCFMAHSDGKHPKRDEATANLIAAMSPDTAKKLIAVALAAKYVAYSNGFDAALPEKKEALSAALEELK